MGKILKRTIEKAKKSAKRVKKGKTKRLPKSTIGMKPWTPEEKKDIFSREYPNGELVHVWDTIKNLGGRPRALESPEEMYKAAEAYFEQVKANPWYEVQYKDHGLVKVPKVLPFTYEGLCLRMGTTHRYFTHFRNNLKKEDPMYDGFSTVLEAIDSAIRAQKFNGGMVGFFNGNLTAYDLGLKKDVPMMMGGATALSVTVVGEQNNKTLEEVKQMLEAIDVEHEDITQQKQLNGKHNGTSNGKH